MTVGRLGGNGIVQTVDDAGAIQGTSFLVGAITQIRVEAAQLANQAAPFVVFVRGSADSVMLAWYALDATLPVGRQAFVEVPDHRLIRDPDSTWDGQYVNVSWMDLDGGDNEEVTNVIRVARGRPADPWNFLEIGVQEGRAARITEVAQGRTRVFWINGQGRACVRSAEADWAARVQVSVEAFCDTNIQAIDVARRSAAELLLAWHTVAADGTHQAWTRLIDSSNGTVQGAAPRLVLSPGVPISDLRLVRDETGFLLGWIQDNANGSVARVKRLSLNGVQGERPEILDAAAGLRLVSGGAAYTQDARIRIAHGEFTCGP